MKVIRVHRQTTVGRKGKIEDSMNSILIGIANNVQWVLVLTILFPYLHLLSKQYV